MISDMLCIILSPVNRLVDVFAQYSYVFNQGKKM